MVADNGVVFRATGHKDEAGVLRLGFFGQQERIVICVRFAARRAKNVGESGELVELGIARSGERPAQAAGKKEKTRVLEGNVDRRVTARGDAGNGARISAVDAETLLHVTEHVMQEIVFPLL